MASGGAACMRQSVGAESMMLALWLVHGLWHAASLLVCMQGDHACRHV